MKKRGKNQESITEAALTMAIMWGKKRMNGGQFLQHELTPRGNVWL
jgi:hypothetical protein